MMKMIWRLSAMGILFLSFFSTPVQAGVKTIMIGSGAALPLSTPDQNGMLDLIVKEAFFRIGRKAEIIQLPSERSLMNADSGITDGDLVRIDGLAKLYPNLVKVPEKICDFDFVAFSKTKGIQLTAGWDSLRPYSVAIITGWKILEQHVHSKTLTKVDNPEMLFAHLDKDRTDMVIYNRHEGYGVIKKMKLDDIVVIEPPLESREMFLYLNKIHKDLIERVAASIRQMKTDGTFSEIVNRSLAKYLP